MGHAHTVTLHPKDSTNGNGRSGGLHGEFAWRAFERAGGPICTARGRTAAMYRPPQRQFPVIH